MGDRLFDTEGPEKAPLGRWRLEQRNPQLGRSIGRKQAWCETSRTKENRGARQAAIGRLRDGASALYHHYIN